MILQIVVVRVILKTQNYLKINLMKKKTSTDQDEDIKVSTYNSDEEKTLSEEKNIEIPEPMDTEPTDPYGKRKIESDSQTNDYLRTFNKDFEID
ncbi:hypothetical protein Gotur_021127, partial [Gossypium turneri]